MVSSVIGSQQEKDSGKYWGNEGHLMLDDTYGELVGLALRFFINCTGDTRSIYVEAADGGVHSGLGVRTSAPLRDKGSGSLRTG